jgi:hypothetical protein
MNASVLESKYDAHEKPPEHFRETFKRFQKIKSPELESDPLVLDSKLLEKQNTSIRRVGVLKRERILQSCLHVDAEEQSASRDPLFSNFSDRPILEHDDLQGKN